MRTFCHDYEAHQNQSNPHVSHELHSRFSAYEHSVNLRRDHDEM